FQVMNYDLTADFREFGDWMMGRDMVPAYRYYKRQLQILAHHTRTRHFLLKCPEHLWFVDALLAVFPDACVVWTHRDPVASVASYCSLSSLQRRMLFGRIDRPAIGAHIQDRFRVGVERAMGARDAVGNPSSFFDVDFTDLVQDPLSMVHRIQAHFGLPRTADADAAMQSWLDNGRKDKRGQHRYSAEQWNLDPAAIHAEYASYIERFAIPVKALDR
ncbi:MAG: sulfotransferase, partial [Myxococcota bacterium]|nr:sulfotransferase [Myxococcota bacterium]